MKIQAGSPARAAWAATALARLPVDAQPTVSRPNATAALIAVATTRSLNDRVGCDTLSFLTQARSMPMARARAGDSTSGVKPVSSEKAGCPWNGSHSRYRQSDGSRAAMIDRSGKRRGPVASYHGSRGPRHSPQIASGAGSNVVPQFRHRWGSGANAAMATSG